jgi:hypothetical protein
MPSRVQVSDQDQQHATHFMDALSSPPGPALPQALFHTAPEALLRCGPPPQRNEPRAAVMVRSRSACSLMKPAASFWSYSPSSSSNDDSFWLYRL